MTTSLARFNVTALILAGLGAGCSSQAGSDYPGEALATIKGAVVANDGAPGSLPPGGAKAAVLWLPRGSMLASARAQVEGAFPSQFTMKLYSPPPEQALGAWIAPTSATGLPMTLDRGPLALGWIVAIAADANESDVHPAEVLGYSLDSMVAYLERDGDPNDPSDDVARYAHLWQLPPTRGYHLIKLEWSDRSAYDLCVWNGFCSEAVDANAGTTAGIRQFLLAADHRNYELCLQAFPAADRCTLVYPDPSIYPDGYPTSNDACVQLAATHGRDVGARGAPLTDCGVPLRRVPNPAGFASSVTVKMGTTFYDVDM
jgi:hypothetical protein